MYTITKEICKPFVKWPGGKSEEIHKIHQYLPKKMDNYIEPFLGGGACFLSLHPEQYENAYVNDLSDELMQMYRYIRDRDEAFFQCLNDVWDLWAYSGQFFQENENQLLYFYNSYKNNELNDISLKHKINHFFDCNENEIVNMLPRVFNNLTDQLISELKKSTISKLKNIRRKEEKEGALPYSDYSSNLESGIRAGVYTFYRYLYNNPSIHLYNNALQTALFFYIREFCYSSMFRYNKNGGFNVPYGGKSYNNKNFNRKIKYLTNDALLDRLSNASFYSLDFKDFFNSINIGDNDFIFLDPPYDGGFSTYAKNDFEQNDQRRLANFLINECNAKFMLIIKNTTFIKSLYEGYNNINIMGFGKDYRVSFMARNDKKVEHLLIKNY